MDTRLRCIELRNAEGKVLYTLHFIHQGENTASRTEQANRRAEQSGTRRQVARRSERREQGNSGDDAAMTDAQKRYLFRLLAERGIEGDEAYQRLKTEFGVDALKDVKKSDASRLIQFLLEGEGGNGDGPPF